MMLLVASLLVALSCVAQGAKYTYNEGSAAGCGLPVGTNYAECGPEYWHQVAGFEKCENTPTSTQTPIDFSNVEMDADLKHPEFDIEEGGCEAYYAGSNDHAYEVGFSEEGCSNLKLVYDKVAYTFLQFHFHSPSEHTIAGAHFSAEAHMVHKSAAGDLLVLSVMLQESVSSSFEMPNNSFLNLIWGGRSLHEISLNSTIEMSEPVNPYKSFTPGSLSQFVYKGSLTTPPCTEEVQWLVYTDPVQVSADDIRILRGATKAFKWGTALSDEGNDNRPVQPLNGRVVKMSSDAEKPLAEDDDGETHKLVIVGSVAIAVAGVLLILLVLFLVYSYFSSIEASGTKPAPGKPAGYRASPQDDHHAARMESQQQSASQVDDQGKSVTTTKGVEMSQL